LRSRDGVFVGIPSVVRGWLGITILVPWLRENLAWAGFNVGFSWFAGSLVLSLMILPTITSISYDVVGRSAGDAHGLTGAGLHALANHPPRLTACAKTGLLTAVILGMMRAAGEHWPCRWSSATGRSCPPRCLGHDHADQRDHHGHGQHGHRRAVE
jgi:ABC-type phosphate transport system permease subunit